MGGALLRPPIGRELVALDARGDLDANAKSDTYLGKHFKEGTRLDYVFWDYDAGPKRKDGFFGKPTLSKNFGSDHLAVHANVYVRANGDGGGASCQVTCCDGSVKSASASSEAACRDQWTVCNIHGYADVTQWKGEAIYDKPSCGN